jgi:hypothetical protein
VWATQREPPFYILGLDPGVVNLGVVLIDALSLEIIYHSNVYIANLADVKKNDAYFATLLSDYFNNTFNFPIQFVAIEQNAQQRWQTVCECAMLGYWCARGAVTYQVHPNTLKAYFQYLGFRGHENNKRDAIYQATELGYPDLSDHEADALLVAYRCAELNVTPYLIQEGVL